MPQTNKAITSTISKEVNAQLDEVENQEPNKVLTKEELSRLKVTRRKTPTPKFQWFTRIISGISLFISNR